MSANRFLAISGHLHNYFSTGATLTADRKLTNSTRRASKITRFTAHPTQPEATLKVGQWPIFQNTRITIKTTAR